MNEDEQQAALALLAELTAAVSEIARHTATIADALVTHGEELWEPSAREYRGDE